MAATSRAPKQWCLTTNETVNSFESWKNNLVYTLSCDDAFKDMIDTEWKKKSKTTLNRGFTGDTAARKATTLELMLGQIANFCPIISRNTIINKSTSLKSIWQEIRLHYGFQSSGSQILDLSEIHLGPDEKPEDLFQRMMAFIEDNLLLKDSPVKHQGEDIAENEEMSPTLENVVIVMWLQALHKDLPKLVKQRYGTELRSQTLSSIKPEISQALGSLLDELRASDTSIHKVFTSKKKENTRHWPSRRPNKTTKSCPLCKAAHRPDQHFLSECKHLPPADKRYLSKARQIGAILEHDDSENESVEEEESQSDSDDKQTYRVIVRQSPSFEAFVNEDAVRVILDTGATGNMVEASLAKRLRLKVIPTRQKARQADGSSLLNVVGECQFQLYRGQTALFIEALVVDGLDVDILAGMPFIEEHNITLEPGLHKITFNDGTSHIYVSRDNRLKIRRTTLRVPQSTTLWPGEHLELAVPSSYEELPECAIEPKETTGFCPDILPIVAGKIRVSNDTVSPVNIKRNDHIANIQPSFTPQVFCSVASSKQPTVTVNTNPQPASHSTSLFSSNVVLDPDNTLPDEFKNKFEYVLQRHDKVFNPKFSGYNGKAGPFEAIVNMGPTLPPQRKGRLPMYNRDRLQELQDKFDELESMGVFMKPEDAGTCVEYVNPSFLVKKPSGNGKRLVTAFADVGRYAKPQPSLMPDVDSTLRQIAQWKFIIQTDLSSAFYQIPLSLESQRFCGVVTPFKGTRVYVRSAMGMPGSETALEELLCRVLGDEIYSGGVTKLADDLFCGADNLSDLLLIWERVLKALSECDLCLSATKTVICPRKTLILGWVWENGHIQASPHKIATLTSCQHPETVKQMRSFIGAYKVLSRVLSGCASVLAPLEQAIAGKESSNKIVWDDYLTASFTNAQKHLTTHRSIALPRPNDQLWIVTDGSVKRPGIGATMYVVRNDKPALAGFFSAKLKERQLTWIPCEIEALAIAVALKHFAPYVVQSTFKTSILTDSKPCVQAFEKLCRGEFSASPRVSTFLSSVSRYQASVRHIAGIANAPSDHASRHPAECTDTKCQVCEFVSTQEECVVLLSVTDVIEGKSKLPFTNRGFWLSVQSECSDLRRVHAHLKQGTRPSKKITNIKDVKRYLQVAKVAKDGLLVVSRHDPLCPSRECIVIPRHIVDGIIFSLHIQLNHPSTHQLKTVCRRYLFALDLNEVIDRVCKTCPMCSSMKNVKPQAEQTTSNPPTTVGCTFAADIMRRERQCILVVRECVTSFTVTQLVENEQHGTLRDALICLLVELCPLDGPPCVVRTDAATGFQALVGDPLLRKHNVTIEIGRIKNLNKNPIAEKAVEELHVELRKFHPQGGSVSRQQLSLATACLNSRLRNRGLSAREMLFHRDQFTNSQLPVNDVELIETQHTLREENHQSSEQSKLKKYPQKATPVPETVIVGDLVYLKCDGDKVRARDRYIVISKDGNWLNVSKFKGSQIRALSYRVKKDEVYKLPCSTASTSSQENIFESEYETPIEEKSIPNKDTLHASKDMLPNNDASKGTGHQIQAPVQMPLDPIPSEIMEPPGPQEDPVHEKSSTVDTILSNLDTAVSSHNRHCDSESPDSKQNSQTPKLRRSKRAHKIKKNDAFVSLDRWGRIIP